MLDLVIPLDVSITTLVMLQDIAIALDPAIISLDKIQDLIFLPVVITFSLDIILENFRHLEIVILLLVIMHVSPIRREVLN